MSREPARVSIVDPPNVEPVLSMSIPTAHGKQVGLSITLTAARELVAELQDALTTIERNRHGRV